MRVLRIGPSPGNRFVGGDFMETIRMGSNMSDKTIEQLQQKLIDMVYDLTSWNKDLKPFYAHLNELLAQTQHEAQKKAAAVGHSDYSDREVAHSEGILELTKRCRALATALREEKSRNGEREREKDLNINALFKGNTVLEEKVARARRKTLLEVLTYTENYRVDSVVLNMEAIPVQPNKYDAHGNVVSVSPACLKMYYHFRGLLESEEKDHAGN